MYVFEALKQGSSGAEVRFLQRSLPWWSWDDPAPSDIDGAYGPGTRNAVSRFQSEMGLTADGVAGSNTCKALGIWADTLLGIDVSDHQGTINWPVVTGVNFVFVKASQGDTFKAKNWAANYTGARGRGLRVGAYHYADGDVPPRTEVNNFLAALGGRPLDLPPALDVEDTFVLTGQAGLDWVHEWLSQVERALGVRPILYTSSRIAASKLNGGDSLKDYKVWFPKWGDQPLNVLPWGQLSIWQYSNSGSVPGITGNVDMNRMVAADF